MKAFSANYEEIVQVDIANGCLIRNGRCLRKGDADWEFDIWLKDLYEFLKPDYIKFFKMDRLSKLGFLAAECVFAEALLTAEEREAVDCWFFSTHASLDADRRYQESIGEPYFPSPSAFVYTLPNVVLGEIGIRHKLFGASVMQLVEDAQPDLESLQAHVETYAPRFLLTGFVDVARGRAKLADRGAYEAHLSLFTKREFKIH